MKRWKQITLLSLLCACSVQSFGNKVALITGITGQDGAYLAELLLSKGYTVHGVKRRTSIINTARIDHLYKDQHSETANNFILHYGDVTDSTGMANLITQIRPDEIYNLAAQSHVQVSFEMPQYTATTDGLGVLHILEGIRLAGLTHTAKFYQASTSEMFGKVQEIPQKETTPFYPRSPYGVAKLYGFWITKNYRESYGMFACNGILFNHESPIRGETFVTRKVVRALVRIKFGLQKKLYLGNLDAKRDWGHARDYVYGMWLMLQQDEPDDYILATGKMYSVREFVELVCRELEIDFAWRGSALDEVGFYKKTGEPFIIIDPKYFRPAEVDLLIGDASKAKKKLGWEPTTTVQELVKEMVEAECNVIKG